MDGQQLPGASLHEELELIGRLRGLVLGDQSVVSGAGAVALAQLLHARIERGLLGTLLAQGTERVHQGRLRGGVASAQVEIGAAGVLG